MSSYEWTDKTVEIVASSESLDELIEILKIYYDESEKIHASSIFEAVLKAVEFSHWDTALYLAKLYKHAEPYSSMLYIPDYYPKLFPLDYEKVLSQPYNWHHFISFVAARVSGSDRMIAQLAPYLLENNLIQLVDYAKRPIRGFHNLLKLVSDPEQLLNTAYDIITGNIKSVDRSDRLQLLDLMKRYGKLLLDPIGPKKLSAPFYCVLADRPYLLSCFFGLSGLPLYRGPNGESFWDFITKHYPYKYVLNLFTKEELKTLLVEKDENGVYKLDLVNNLRRAQLPSVFVSALKELLMEDKLKDSEEVRSLKLLTPHIGAKFVYQHGKKYVGLHSEYEEAVRSHYQSVVSVIENIGDSSFQFSELPSEIIQIIVKDMSYSDMRHLLATSKGMQRFKDKCINDYYYEQVMRQEFGRIYCDSIDRSAANIDWKNHVETHIRRAYNWRSKSPSEENVIFQSCDGGIQYFDENWLIMGGRRNKISLWNVKQQKMHQRHYMFYSGKRLVMLDSPENDFPFAIELRNNGIYTVNYSGYYVLTNPLKAECEFYNKKFSVASVSRDQFIVTGTDPFVYSVERDQVVTKIEDIVNVYHAVHNKVNQMTVLSSDTTTDIVDKNFQFVHSLPNNYPGDLAVKWLDVYLFARINTHDVNLCDLRMLRDFTDQESIAYKTFPLSSLNGSQSANIKAVSTGNTVMEVDLSSRLGCVWNLKDGTWSNVVVLPDDVIGEPICTSRYAAFVTNKRGVRLLDFGA